MLRLLDWGRGLSDHLLFVAKLEHPCLSLFTLVMILPVNKELLKDEDFRGAGVPNVRDAEALFETGWKQVTDFVATGQEVTEVELLIRDLSDAAEEKLRNFSRQVRIQVLYAQDLDQNHPRSGARSEEPGVLRVPFQQI